MDSARARLIGDPDDPELVVRAMLEETADFTALRQRIETEALTHARQALGNMSLPAQLDLTITDRRSSPGQLVLPGRPARRRQRVLHQHAVVTGPTPPGTGVSTEAIPVTAAASTSPASPPPPSVPSEERVSSVGVVPTSITTAPGRT